MKNNAILGLLASSLLSSASAATLWTEGFENSFPPAGWMTNSVDLSTTYTFNGTNSVRLNATSDYLITPKLVQAKTLIFWSYTTAANPPIVVEYAANTNGPWTAAAESPFFGYTEQWNGQFIDLSGLNEPYVRFRKTGSGTVYLDDISVEDGLTASNQPPILASIGNYSVLAGGVLSFPVTATDPVDHHTITLTAAPLPSGAIFTNGVFSWSNAAPIGSYSVTFVATDADGSDSETCLITVLPRPDLLISEVADPSGTGSDVFRFVELYNAGSNTIQLAANQWTLSKQVNGGSWYDIPLTGTLSAAGCWVIAYNAAEFQTAYGRAPDQEHTAVSGNGDDAYFLFYGGNHTNGTLIDVYGELNTDGTDTAWEYEDSRAKRNNLVLKPNNRWTTAEWTISTSAKTNEMTPGVHGPIPEFYPLNNPFVFLGNSLELPVTAVNSVRSDVITLSAHNLPTGATFATVTGTNTVSSILIFNNPTTGVYVVSFSATGFAGTQTTSITVTVNSRVRLDGLFYGWTGDTIFKLKNGQFWQQSAADAKSVSPALNDPYVTITNSLGRQRMTVSGVTGSIFVQPLDVNESAVTNRFTGLHNGTIYQLSDGSSWEQITFENNPDNAESVTAWRWIKNGQTMLRFLNSQDRVLGTCTVKPAGDLVNPAKTSQIDGNFLGWQHRRVFALANGEFWQQTSLDLSTRTLYQPAVTLTNYLQTGNWLMSLDGESGSISVQQLTNVIRTAVDGYFYGFSYQNFFRLSNGSWWQQTSTDHSTTTRQNPDVLLWNESGIDYLEIPEEGLAATVIAIAVQREGVVTNDFTGLHYGNTYQMGAAGDWIQFSFENIPTNSSSPYGMLWAANAQTNLLVRDSHDRFIGTCVVADSAADSDQDGLINAAELIAGMDPQDRTSRFELRQTEAGVMNWNAVEGRVYTIEWTPALTESFQIVETNLTWPQNNWRDTIHSSRTQGFYRIRVRLAD
ncbi:MAG: hypothetical protein FJ220_02155 [Kiritimatiellaceae bacterium]|nr:hypothetical protein [Kiritimatiellaceae bacterium]